MSADLLRRAAAKLRQHATAALKHDDERWTVDQSTDHGLVVGSYVPEDVSDDGYVSTGCLAFFAYPDDEQGKAYDGAFDVASYMALMHPQVALALADWLDFAAGLDEPITPGIPNYALAVARAVLREEDEPR